MLKLSIVSVTFNNLVGLIKTCVAVDELSKLVGRGIELEHVIVDGGSRDGTNDFLINRSLMLKGLQFRFVSEADKGIYDAMNKGSLLASGDYVVFLNAGDEISTDFDLSIFLKNMVENLVDTKSAGLAYSSFVRYNHRHGRKIVAREVGLKNPRLPTVHQSMFYKRSVILCYGFSTKFSICGDYENFSRLFSDGLKFKPINNVFSIFGADGVSAHSPLRLFVESSSVTWAISGLGLVHKIKVTGRLVISLLIHTFFVFVFRLI